MSDDGTSCLFSWDKGAAKLFKSKIFSISNLALSGELELLRDGGEAPPVVTSAFVQEKVPRAHKVVVAAIIYRRAIEEER